MATADRDPFALYLPDSGPDTRVLVTYLRDGNRCVLPGRYVGVRRNGDHVIEVERVNTHTGNLVARYPRVIRADELVSMEEVRD